MIETFAGFVLIAVVLKVLVAGLLLACTAFLIIRKLQGHDAPAVSSVTETGTVGSVASRVWSTV